MPTLHGLTTMVLTADEVDEAVRWYTALLGTEAYFRMPPEGPAAYVEFRLGRDEDELGIMQRSFAPGAEPGTGSVIAYWHVDDVASALAECVAAGAAEHLPVTDRGEGFQTASVVDPFGNVLGLMHSPHWAGDDD